MKGKVISLKIISCVFLALSLLIADLAKAETQIRIIAEKKGFPIAVPDLCDLGKGGEFHKEIAQLLIKNITLTGLFRVPDTSKVKSGCTGELLSDMGVWSGSGAEAVVRGSTKAGGFEGQRLVVELYLYDLAKKKAVIGKSYDVGEIEAADVALKFSNEIIKYFTGQQGLFDSQIVFAGGTKEASRELYLLDLNGQKLTQLTKDGGIVSSPAWSPKGDQVVYSLTKDGNTDLFILSPSKKIPRQLTVMMGEERYPNFSPDGNSILSTAFVSGKASIVLFNLRGRLLKNLTPYTMSDVSASYSPDGKQIAFCSDQEGKRQIYVMKAEGGAAKKISYAKLDQCHSPNWSSRGDWVAFVCETPAGGAIYAANPTGSDVIQLTFGGDNKDPSWSADGNMLVYVAKDSETNGRKQLAIYSLLSGKSEMLDTGLVEIAGPAWSPQ
ncbi:MAG: PD40 domain-containing protein [Deltaproteobacteria bacterium]|nr:PD40 domain-containing protein [Deltaproteobacteria bacterium]